LSSSSLFQIRGFYKNDRLALGLLERSFFLFNTPAYSKNARFAYTFTILRFILYIIFYMFYNMKNIKEEYMRVVNLTPHAINVRPDGASANLVIQPSGQVALVTSTQVVLGNISIMGFSVPIIGTTYGEIECLPEPAPDTVYIVSGLVMAALKGSRQDVIQPDTSPSGVIRNSEGQIVAVKGFQRQI